MELHEWKRKEFAALAESFEGAEAIYVERPLVLHVRVTDISFDDWGVKAKATDLLQPGMQKIPQSPFDIFFAWEVFAFNKGEWDTPNIPQCRFRLFFDASVVRPAVKLVAEANRRGSIIDWGELEAVTKEYHQRGNRKRAKAAENPGKPGTHGT